jgi:hypothetical protein
LFAEQPFDIVVEQLTVDLQAAILDAGGCRRVEIRIAQVRGEPALLRLQARWHAQGLMRHARRKFRGACDCIACSRRGCVATSPVRSANAAEN